MQPFTAETPVVEMVTMMVRVPSLIPSRSMLVAGAVVLPSILTESIPITGVVVGGGATRLGSMESEAAASSFESTGASVGAFSGSMTEVLMFVDFMSNSLLAQEYMSLGVLE